MIEKYQSLFIVAESNVSVVVTKPSLHNRDGWLSDMYITNSMIGTVQLA